MFKKGLAIVTCLFVLSGCTAGQKNQGADENQNIHISEVKQTVDNKQKNLNGKQVARRLVNIATRIPDVHDATAIVAGDYAVVGIDIDKDLDRTKAGNIKNSVTEALTKDPYGANAIVTSDPDIIQRLKNMGAEIRKGKPLSGIAGELALIVERLVPEVPNKVIPDKNETNDQNKIDQSNKNNQKNVNPKINEKPKNQVQ
ncbi:YhcN/YlaJ family sporulation lipoprotein [Pullulanibacillus pueri]|uniref:Putative lipoprotein YlaJ n=1 Tax=Pullulanibacillus pueri TaxID=1437324 RepID=A0A8J2ZR88_9BACL|nr:YhcN/YlaJ family sporulation lipoprotein [Pullulanibacillus pueri]MBM7680090.1 YhcN/YlaJ family sporulation lipoprotein [Pullulanibacillus pueri]GGH74319.1 putative lipoprotein YlaJ [Pullulanibacillus pueri]